MIHDVSELSQYGTDLKYNVSGSSIPYNVCLDTPAVDYSLYKWVQLTYPSTYKTMTTSAFISSGIPNKKVLKGCNNAANCFENCQAITEAPFNITSNKCYDICHAFHNCYNLTSTPIIPEGVTSMWATFKNCYNLTSAPIIPNNIIDMYGTFAYCINLNIAPLIPNKVINMKSTFRQCFNLNTAPLIPNSVTDMSWTFSDCYNLLGNIYIHSNKINNCTSSFRNHSSLYRINLYVHPGTTTYSTFYSYLGGTYNSSLNIQLKTF